MALCSLILDFVTLRLLKNVLRSLYFGFIVSVSRCRGFLSPNLDVTDFWSRNLNAMVIWSCDIDVVVLRGSKTSFPLETLMQIVLKIIPNCANLCKSLP